MLKTTKEKALAILLIVAAYVIINQHLALRVAWRNEQSLAMTINQLHKKWP